MKPALAVAFAVVGGGLLALVLLIIGHRLPVEGYDDEPPYGDV